MFSYLKWLNTSFATRIRIAEILDIPKTEPIHVSDNVVVSDGYKIKDVDAALSIEKLSKVTNKTGTQEELFDFLVEMIEKPQPIQEIPDESASLDFIQAEPSAVELKDVVTDTSVNEEPLIINVQKNEEPKENSKKQERVTRGTKKK